MPSYSRFRADRTAARGDGPAALYGRTVPRVVTILTASVALLTAPPAMAAPWQRPVHGPILRPFALAADPFARGQHRGVDLGSPPGRPVLSACAGRVTFAGRVPGGGRTVSVRCGRHVATYQHLATVSVQRARAIVAGAALGSVGRSGRPRAGHVHLSARVAATGRYVDPLTLLGAGPRPVPPIPRPAGPQRHPLPLGPAPAPARTAPQPGIPPALIPPTPVVPAASGAPRAPAAPRLPWTSWAGLACLAAGLPAGGLVARRRHRRASRDLRGARGVRTPAG